ncbi:eukaryotic translation initiation factor 5 [Ischnura elegans]|uniref:eukaryotic translation initiation factor 5 n=1 Tax=Ischnura elegans TaxID=197161 RepID=UPI001ED899BF|nr:eukaryotic translation initiation factor 5 [Ischnura elegans]XP_046382764.1 eukaryotic translation initiation factor 5 [Ischnura elegans]XP_046382766.1 eukaryotic translation initiation factor 5 [Ischnura elegans]XP_046382767.1 eukaryotic translation initiation factor 5 [Ischnura elegans]
MGSLNVNRNVSDAFYRYKMPRLMAKVEGKGNGIKTVIVNMVEIAKALCRPPTYPTKYFGCELGAQTQFDFKNDRFIVNGSHDAAKLQDLLDGFIRRFVLCPECDNPETSLIISQKKGTITQACKACGYHGPIEINHKLNTFILKNPPDVNPAAQGASLTEGKRGRRSKKQQNGETNGDGRVSPRSDSNDTDVPNSERDVGDNSEEDSEWAVDVSEEAVRARMQDLTDGAKGMTISDDLEKSEKERMDIFYGLMKRRRDEGSLENPTTHRELLAEAERLEIRSKAPLVLAELLFDQQINTQVKKHRLLLLRFTHEDSKAQKCLIGGIEQVIGLHQDALLPKVPLIFKLFYDLDILDEKVILEWATKVSKKYVWRELSQEIHNKAEPFIKWLREAEEEESDSEEEEDDDVEIQYDDRAKASPLKEQPKKVQPAAPKVVDDGEDDLDIDAI